MRSCEYGGVESGVIWLGRELPMRYPLHNYDNGFEYKWLGCGQFWLWNGVHRNS